MPRRCAATEGADPFRFVTAIAHPPFRVYMAKTQWVPGHRGRCRRSHREWCAWVRGSEVACVDSQLAHLFVLITRADPLLHSRRGLNPECPMCVSDGTQPCMSSG